MPLPFSNFNFQSSSDSAPWSRRVLENFRAALSTVAASHHPATALPVNFSSIGTSTRYGSAQGFSFLFHLLASVLLVFLIAAGRHPSSTPGSIGIVNHPTFQYTPPSLVGEKPSLGAHGAGSGNENDLARAGQLPPVSSFPLAPPRLTHSEPVDLPVPPAVFDPNAPANVPTITQLGLPWKNKDTDSAGREKGHGIGDKLGDGAGDDDGNGVGRGGDGGPYANVVSPAACQYCPEPPYTEEARKQKLQGRVTLQVLVGVDGRAKRIQVLKGLGLGLDERAVETIRSWHFVPARDARRQPIPTWVTIETRFQLL